MLIALVESLITYVPLLTAFVQSLITYLSGRVDSPGRQAMITYMCVRVDSPGRQAMITYMCVCVDSPALTAALRELATQIPQLKKDIQDGLLKMLSYILMGHHLRHPGASGASAGGIGQLCHFPSLASCHTHSGVVRFVQLE